MTHFRIRPWGSAEWTQIVVAGDDEETEALLAGQLRESIPQEGFHAQELVEGEWEDL